MEMTITMIIVRHLPAIRLNRRQGLTALNRELIDLGQAKSQYRATLLKVADLAAKGGDWDG